MSNGKNPLMLMMALSMPGAAHAIGLGDIHVDSALNERLAAEIDIVGATELDLTDLRAAVANRETFLRYGADRPAFLSSATFKVTQNSHGRPVITVRSTESFTEPVVNLLVDLRWRNGELVREYTLLLDPPGFASAPPAPAAPKVPAAPPAATPIVETKTQTMARQVDPPADQSDPGAERAVRKTTHIKVGARATLRGVAWRVGERSESDLQRMMIAIFRANPAAFDGNINRLHRGAVLTIPSHAEAAAISRTEAQREVHAQMAAWRTPVPAPAISGDATETPANEALDHRIQSLERELNSMKGQFDSERDQLVSLQEQAARVEKAAPVAAAPVVAAPVVAAPRAADSPVAHSKIADSMSVPIAAGLGILAAALAGLYFKFRRRAPAMRDSRAAGNATAADNAAAGAGDGSFDAAPATLLGTAPQPAPVTTAMPVEADTQEHAHDHTHDGAPTDIQAILETDANAATHPMLPVMPAAKPAVGRSEIAAAASSAVAHDTTVNLRVDTVNLRVDQTRLDYNLVDLDMTAQHVQMPSVLNEHAVVKERRTNLADVLKLAIEREPDRHDLRMKLLELYYSAAATNRQAFLETVQKFARDRDYLQADQWDKIAYMGRQIASENPLFAEASADDDDLADCA